MKIIAEVLVVAMLMSAIGCTGNIADAGWRYRETDKSYADLKPLPAPVAGNGRMYFYRTKDSTRKTITYGGSTINIVNYIIDDQVHYLLYETFRYHDLPLGTYEITSGDVIKEVSTGSAPSVFQRGKQKLNVTLDDNKEVFIRLDLIDNQPTPVPVDAATAKKELDELMRMKNLESIATTVD